MGWRVGTVCGHNNYTLVGLMSYLAMNSEYFMSKYIIKALIQKSCFV